MSRTRVLLDGYIVYVALDGERMWTVANPRHWWEARAAAQEEATRLREAGWAVLARPTWEYDEWVLFQCGRENGGFTYLREIRVARVRT